MSRPNGFLPSNHAAPPVPHKDQHDEYLDLARRGRYGVISDALARQYGLTAGVVLVRLTYDSARTGRQWIDRPLTFPGLSSGGLYRALERLTEEGAVQQRGNLLHVCSGALLVG